MRYLALALLLIGFSGCRSMENSVESKLNGNWVEPIEGMPNQYQGFTLSKKNIASSINMATLVYDKWAVENDSTLLLWGKSIGNGVTIDFIDTLQVVTITPKDLTVRQNGVLRTFIKK